MSHAVGTYVCCPAAFVEAITVFQLTALPDQSFLQGVFFSGFQLRTPPACTGAQLGGALAIRVERLGSRRSAVLTTVIFIL
ncbi:hypothetical protein EVAR_9869_1 [Eumeta japonica]|uniref:Uncharacterized protein n=1 Tax=Eumeta variegata TaxID=151549 RepID=A0A4C1TQ86_EUMVA|nr:hypothetical protein EVAR_9869_1 [Eumeta japonica]